MEKSILNVARKKAKRAIRVRRKLRGTAEKPRMCVVKTNSHISVQLIDDEKGITLGAISTHSKEVRGTEHGRKNKESAKFIGAQIASIAKEKNIESVIFDRGSSKYHGVIAAVADSARESGLQI